MPLRVGSPNSSHIVSKYSIRANYGFPMLSDRKHQQDTWCDKVLLLLSLLLVGVLVILVWVASIALGGEGRVT